MYTPAQHSEVCSNSVRSTFNNIASWFTNFGIAHK